MRDDWCVATLGDLLRRRTNRLGSQNDPGVLTVSEEHGLVDQMAHWGRRIATEDVSKYKIVDPGDVVYNIYLLWAGAIGQSTFNSQKITSPVYEVFTPTERSVPEYVGLAIQNPALIQLFDAISIGTVGRRRRAPWADFLKVPVVLPPIREQHRIVDLVKSIDTAITTAQGEVDAARGFENDLFEGLISRYAAETTRQPLGELGDFIRGRRFIKSDYVPIGLGCIHYGQVHTHFGSIATQPLTFVPEAMRSRLRLATNGDLIIAATSENIQDLGKTTVWLGDDDVAVHDDCYIFRHRLDPRFATFALATHDFHSQKVQYAAGTKVTRISSTNLAKIVVPVPTRESQVAIGQAMTDLGSAVSTAQTALDRLRNLRASVLSVLLSGEHKMPESYDQFMAVSNGAGPE